MQLDPQRQPGRRFYSSMIYQVPGLARLAATVETWWQAIQASLQLRIGNTSTEKTTARSSVSSATFRNQDPDERRIMPNNTPPRRDDHRAEPTVTLHREEPSSVLTAQTTNASYPVRAV